MIRKMSLKKDIDFNIINYKGSIYEIRLLKQIQLYMSDIVFIELDMKFISGVFQTIDTNYKRDLVIIPTLQIPQQNVTIKVHVNSENDVYLPVDSILCYLNELVIK